MAKGDLHIDPDALGGHSDALDAILAQALDGLDEEIWPYAQNMLHDPMNRGMWRDAITDAVFSRISTGIIRSQAEVDGFFDELSDVGGWGVHSTGHDVDSDLYRKVVRVVHRVSGHALDLNASEDGRHAGFMGGIEAYVRSEVGMAEKVAMAENVKSARRAGVDIRFASVPTGVETCTFCAMLASRGFDFTKLDNSHWHKGCRCRAVPGKKGHTKIPGYDPAEWKDTWKAYKEIDARDDLSWAEKEHARSVYFRQTELTVSIPANHVGDFDDFIPLEINDDVHDVLTHLNMLSKESNFEYLQVRNSDGWTEVVTDEKPAAVAVPKSAHDGENVEIYHSHTNVTPLSRDDFAKLCLDNVDAVGNIAINGDVYIARIGSGYRPTVDEYEETTRRIAHEVDLDILNDPEFENWSIEERNYMAIREQAYRIARHYEWELMGGNINVAGQDE